jgi:hypothetical protein
VTIHILIQIDIVMPQPVRSIHGVGTMFVMLALHVLFPQIALWLPAAMR